jgi:TRAP-type mannitol/chloroaromatic compound transport system substrate-binding protein
MKKILTTVAAAALLWGVVQPGEAWAQRALDVASTFPKNMVYLGEGAENLAKLLEDVSAGKLKMKVHGAGDLVPALEVFGAVSSGAVPAGWDWIGYWGGTVPVTALMGAMPFGPTPEVFLGWMWEGGGLEILQKAYDKHNIKVLPCHLTAPEAGGWFNKQINKPEDFKGLKMRISGMGGKVINKLGASSQMIPGGEIYLALERGRIEATEFSLPIIDKSLGFQNIAKYYYFPGWHQPASWNSLIINMNVWKKYSETEQKQFMAACRANVVWSMAVAPAAQGKVLDEFRAKGVKVLRFPEPVLVALRKETAEVLREEAAKDPIFKEALASLTSYIKVANDWLNLQALPRQ